MDVDDAHREGVEEHVGEQAHEPREHDPLDAAGAQHVDHGRVEGAPVGVPRVIDGDGLHAGRPRAVQRPRARDVRHDDGDPCIELACGDGVEDGLEVGAAARGEHAQRDHEPPLHALLERPVGLDAYHHTERERSLAEAPEDFGRARRLLARDDDDEADAQR